MIFRLLVAPIVFFISVFWHAQSHANIFPCEMRESIYAPLKKYECANPIFGAKTYSSLPDGVTYSSGGEALAALMRIGYPPPIFSVEGPAPGAPPTYSWDWVEGNTYFYYLRECFEGGLCRRYAGQGGYNESQPWSCPPGFTRNLSQPQGFLPAKPPLNSSQTPHSPSPEAGYPCYRKRVIEINIPYTPPPPGSCVGNPIYPLLGSKAESVRTGFFVGGTEVVLTYDSRSKTPETGTVVADKGRNATSLGLLWAHSLDKKIVREGTLAENLGSYAIRGNGDVLYFKISGGSQYRFSAIKNDEVRSLGTAGWRYYNSEDSSVETYDGSGVLQSITYTSGNTVTLSYSTASTSASIAPLPGYLIRAQDNKGRLINFEYTLIDVANSSKGAKLSKVTDSSARSLHLTYDSNLNLTKIVWPDGKNRTFVYERADLPWALTGVIDENSVRFSTFGYDTAGRAISTEHAGGKNKFSTSYGTGPSRTFLREVDDVAANVIYRSLAG
jgi:hypothetical protein